jgi:ribonuclease III
MFFIKKISLEDKLLCKNIREKFGIKPKNISYYKSAFTHENFRKEDRTKKIPENYRENERLEFLGDAVLSLIVAEQLYKTFPNYTEGDLTIIRSEIVSRKTINNFGNYYHINDLIILNNKEKLNSVGINTPGNTFESLLAAIYLDRGHDYCQKFLTKTIDLFFPKIKSDFIAQDYKSKLIQFSQHNKKEIEFYTNENKEANEKKSHFLCEIYFSKKFISSGKGENKRDAEQIAAKKALTYIKNQLL